jgi:hypothetical protein
MRTLKKTNNRFVMVLEECATNTWYSVQGAGIHLSLSNAAFSRDAR